MTMQCAVTMALCWHILSLSLTDNTYDTVVCSNYGCVLAHVSLSHPGISYDSEVCSNYGYVPVYIVSLTLISVMTVRCALTMAVSRHTLSLSH
jgi:hypothetical protein